MIGHRSLEPRSSIPTIAIPGACVPGLPGIVSGRSGLLAALRLGEGPRLVLPAGCCPPIGRDESWDRVTGGREEAAQLSYRGLLAFSLLHARGLESSPDGDCGCAAALLNTPPRRALQ